MFLIIVKYNNKINIKGIKTNEDLYKLKKFKMLLDPSEKTITINPDININILNLEKLIWDFDFITRQPVINPINIT